MSPNDSQPVEARAAMRAAAMRRLANLLARDEALLIRMQTLRAPHATAIMAALTRFGDAEAWTLLGLALAAAGGPGRRMARRLLVSAALGALIAQPIKRSCCRRRPDRAIEGYRALADSPDAFSFPSGHTACAVSVAIAFAGEGDFLGTFFGVVAAGIGASRVYLGAHYPLDVVAGGFLGVAAGMLSRLLLAGDSKTKRPPRRVAVFG